MDELSLNTAVLQFQAKKQLLQTKLSRALPATVMGFAAPKDAAKKKAEVFLSLRFLAW